MKVLAFAPGRVGPLPAYLGYLFLRFPGTLGPEEHRVVECVDTYDRRWSQNGQVWVRCGGALTLVSPPSLFPDDLGPAAFGLQAPIVVGRVTVHLRPLTFASEGPPIEGEIVRVRNRSWLVLKDTAGERFEALTRALIAEGLEPDGGWWVPGGSGFVPAIAWESPRLDDPASGFLLGRLADGFRVARQYEKGIRDDVDTECLHRYRVFLRRVRSMASLGRQWEVIPEWARLKTVLRTLQQKTNELRDLDVLLLDLPALSESLPWSEGTNLIGWREGLERRRHAEQRRVKAWFESEEHRFLTEESVKLFSSLEPLGDPWTVADLAYEAFRRSAKRMRAALNGLSPDPADEVLHEVRIEAKRLRYVLDALGGLGPAAPLKFLVSTLKETQDSLGRFQDRSLLLARLRAGVGEFRSGAVPGDPLAYGMLVGVLIADQQGQKIQARKAAMKLKSQEFLKALERLIASLAPGGSHGS
jgi:CHAD domain-containing protein